MSRKQHLPLAFAAILACAGCKTMPATEATQGSMVPSLAATIAAMPKNIPRPKAPTLPASIAAAQAAIDLCTARGVTITALIADVEGKPVVILSSNGVGYRSQLIAQSKANIVARFKMASSEVEQRSKTNSDLATQAQNDPGIGVLRGGGLPAFRNGEMIAIVAVSGASLANGDLTLDETCARAGVTSLENS